MITKSQKAMSLIELMVTVAILSIGIIGVARSFLVVTNALSYTQNKILALEFLDSKIGQVRQEVLNQSSYEDIDTSGEVRLNNKDFSWKISISSLGIGEAAEEAQNIKELSARAVWKESNRKRDQIIKTYLKIKDETE